MKKGAHFLVIVSQNINNNGKVDNGQSRYSEPERKYNTFKEFKMLMLRIKN